MSMNREFEHDEFQLQLRVFTPSLALHVYKTWSRTSHLLGSPTPSPSQKKPSATQIKMILCASRADNFDIDGRRGSSCISKEVSYFHPKYPNPFILSKLLSLL